jgi:hypothetical protein
MLRAKRKNDTLQLIVRIHEFEAAESKNYTRRRRCNGRDCDGQRRQLWGCGGSFILVFKIRGILPPPPSKLMLSASN